MNDIVGKLKENLESAQKKESVAIENAQKSFGENERADYFNAHQELLAAERNLARALDQEFAEPLDFPVQWDTGAPLPFLLQNEYKSFLTFYVKEVDPNWDGSYVNVVDPGSENNVNLALVTFSCCTSTKFGSPNDEVLDGHPLEGKGLDSYTAQVVRNSKWIKELQKINSVHSCYNPESWSSLNHYIFWFHDSTFECVAESYKVEVYNTNMQKLLTQIGSELLK